MKITQPTLLLDENKSRQNIKMMVAKALKNQTILRPHFKSHQSHEIGRWFREEGVDRITVSSVKMAQYFAEDGWEDITIAFPVNILEIDAINQLAKQVNLNILVEAQESVTFMERHLKNTVGAFIKIDVGTNRTGVDPDNLPALEGLIELIDQSSKIQFKGLLAHAGHSYRSKSIDEILQVHRGSTMLMKKLKSKLKDNYPELLLSVGDTPTCSRASDFQDMDEIRPGNFVFYDAMQLQIRSCEQHQVAVAMACPIVALHPERSELVIYGGGVHFSKDSMVDERLGKHFGLVVSPSSTGWGEIIPNTFLHQLSQEHGIIRAPKSFIEQQKIGDLVYILPVHSCMTADLLKSYQTLDGKLIGMMK